MKIGVLVYPHYDFPPEGYGPMQEVACNLAEGLVKKGHEVSIFATADAKLSPQIKVIPTKESSIIKDKSVPDPKIYEFLTLAQLLEHRNDFDVLSSHIGFHILPFIEFLKYPVVVNLQGDYSNPHYHHILELYKNANFVSISHAQQQRVPSINFIANIYHGLDINKFPFTAQPDDYLAFLGRTSPVKGLGDAIEVAKATHHQLLIGARIDAGPEGEKYFAEEIKPQIDDKNIVWLGERNEKGKLALLSKAKTLLFPIHWEEAFGLVMIEAMACGTPVIAYDRGSVREIVKDGETGFICPPDDMECMTRKVQEIYEMPKEKYQEMRRNSRKHVEENFTVEKMVDKYEQIFKKVVDDWKAKKEK